VKPAPLTQCLIDRTRMLDDLRPHRCFALRFLCSLGRWPGVNVPKLPSAGCTIRFSSSRSLVSALLPSPFTLLPKGQRCSASEVKGNKLEAAHREATCAKSRRIVPSTRAFRSDGSKVGNARSQLDGPARRGILASSPSRSRSYGAVGVISIYVPGIRRRESSHRFDCCLQRLRIFSTAPT
jgi:hypothetical protein